MDKTEAGKFVLYRDVEDSYRWRLRSPTGETLAASPSGHPEKSDCEDEVRAAMAARPGAGLRDATAKGGGHG